MYIEKAARGWPSLFFSSSTLASPSPPAAASGNIPPIFYRSASATVVNTSATSVIRYVIQNQVPIKN